jgi:2-dehydropantoate 2-reductase
MRIAITGAGAVGGYFGARLAAAGHDVTFISRGERLEAMRAGGLRVESIDGDVVLDSVSATDDPAEVGIVELVVFAVKSTDTRDAAEAARPLVGPGTVVLAIQNGVDNEAVIGEVLGEEHVVPGVAVIGVGVPEVGTIRHTNNGTITLGEVSGEETGRVRAICQAFAEAGVGTRVSTDILSVKWRKLIWNAAFNPLAALTGRGVLDLIEDEDIRTLAEDAMREAIAVGEALGHRVGDYQLERATRRDPNWAHSKTSMLQDIERGRPTEIEALTGAVVRGGERTGVPTPVSSTLLRLVRARERADKGLCEHPSA